MSTFHQDDGATSPHPAPPKSSSTTFGNSVSVSSAAPTNSASSPIGLLSILAPSAFCCHSGTALRISATPSLLMTFTTPQTAPPTTTGSSATKRCESDKLIKRRRPPSRQWRSCQPHHHCGRHVYFLGPPLETLLWDFSHVGLLVLIAIADLFSLFHSLPFLSCTVCGVTDGICTFAFTSSDEKYLSYSMLLRRRSDRHLALTPKFTDTVAYFGCELVLSSGFNVFLRFFHLLFPLMFPHSQSKSNGRVVSFVG